MTIQEACAKISSKKARAIQRKGLPSTRLILEEGSDLWFQSKSFTYFDLLETDWELVSASQFYDESKIFRRIG